jgi:carboxylate-amine ligase
MLLEFKKNDTALTLGVETEVQLLDVHTLRLVPRAPDLIEMLPNSRLMKEMFRSTVELVTGVCPNVQTVHKELREILLEITQAGSGMGLRFASTGTHPVADYNNRILTASSRYKALLDRNQWLIKRMAVYGLHVHIGMLDGDSCIRFNNFFLHFIPHLIALSASSPFWKGRDTGLAASRPTVYEAHPTSGLPVIVNNWKEFNKLYSILIRTGSIQSMKDVWWDMRPSPDLGTLEIRICDSPATLLELESITALIHMLALWFQDHSTDFIQRHTLKPLDWVMRENKWRAIRFGTEAEIISQETFEKIKLSDQLFFWLDRLQPYAQNLGYEKYIMCLGDIIVKGNSTTRQRKVMAETQDIMQVVRHNIHEFEKREPGW